MRQIYKTIASVFIVLILASTIVYAKDQIRNEKDSIVTSEENTPVSTDQIATVEQSTYNDIWALYNTTPDPTYVTEQGGCTERTVNGMSKTIYLRYPSTLTVQFSGETELYAYSYVNVRVLIDGISAYPGWITFAVNEGFDTVGGAHSLTFFKDNVSKGNHIIKVKMCAGTTDGGHDGYDGLIEDKTMIITANGYGH